MIDADVGVKASGNSNSVNQQSGLFAGDGGYHV
ncbi:hypothetical protein PGK19_18825, partial [Acinetobacter baumannii]